MQKIILASASPRRKQLLEQIGLEFICAAADVNEDKYETMPPQDLVKNLALDKAQEVARRNDNAIIIAADTVVVLNSIIMGKPANRDDALRKLSMLSGREHQVMTGISVINQPNQTCDSEVEVTRVFFRHLSNAEIQGYLDSGEWIDKAGGYGIQGLGALLIEKIDGCYFNVVGLPLSKLYQLLYKQGVNALGRKTPDGVQGWD